MKDIRKKITTSTLAVLLLTSAGAFVYGAGWSRAQIIQSSKAEINPNRNPQTYQDCLPDQVKKVELTASVANKQNNYYLLDVYGNNNEFWEELIQVNSKKGCTSLISNNNLEDWPSQYLPMKTARELALQAYSRKIKRVGGKKAFQQIMNEEGIESYPAEVEYLPPEYAWALQQLGIRIPSSYKIIDPKEGVPQL